MLTQVDRDLLLEFFLTFSRFEFALKNAGYIQHSSQADPVDPPDAKPNWDAFAAAIRGTFRQQGAASFKGACDYLAMTPPWREVILNGALGWTADPPPKEMPIEQRTLLCVRRLRNNLFHGGSLSPVHGYDAATTESLLKACTEVLTQSSKLSSRMQAAYGEAAL